MKSRRFFFAAHAGRIALMLAVWAGAIMSVPLWAKDIRTNPQAPVFTQQSLVLVEKILRVDIADSAAKREWGLMFRETLTDDEGMLFVFPRTAQHCFWMRNTPLPLTIIFIDESNRIVDVQDMQAQSEKVHCPAQEARYALEINQGWLSRHAKGTTPLKITHPNHPHNRVRLKSAWPQAKD